MTNEQAIEALKGFPLDCKIKVSIGIPPKGYSLKGYLLSDAWCIHYGVYKDKEITFGTCKDSYCKYKVPKHDGMMTNEQALNVLQRCPPDWKIVLHIAVPGQGFLMADAECIHYSVHNNKEIAFATGGYDCMFKIPKKENTQ